MNLRFLHDHVLVLVTDVRKIPSGKVPSLDPMSQEHARRRVAQEKVLLKIDYNLLFRHN